ncbi:hypothetical protein GSY74_07820 [Sulfurovum sp. bin170]|uniref:hypothetical protein n=1 Tax=Sulfurovum sp. bin170 TaxID=2695268 RepID=UPI0013DF0F0A|nr:hypothetical protein [Sulfurovum sp. bin170]NEW61187.1 hypothetical protein [Sulfurovum sp. bin170]
MSYSNFLKSGLTSTLLLLLVGCGGGGGGSSSGDDGFQNLDLYGFNLSFTDNQFRYEMENISDSTLLPHYFDFGTDDFELESEDRQIFVNQKRGSSNDVSYSLESSGSMVAKDDENIFRLSITAIEDVKLERLDAYRTKPLTLEGKKYVVKKEYLANYYAVERLTSDTTFDSLTEFTAKHTQIPFIGSRSYGLVFGEEGKLQAKQREDDKYADVGSYEIKEIEGQKILFVYSDNLNQYDAHGCYILDYGFVWEARCHLKDSSEELDFYNREIYEPILEYMQTNFVDITISI